MKLSSIIELIALKQECLKEIYQEMMLLISIHGIDAKESVRYKILDIKYNLKKEEIKSLYMTISN